MHEATFAPERVWLIVNPTAGGGDAERVAVEVVRRLRQHGWQVDSYWTATAAEALRLARAATAADVDAVAVIGGDGTLRSVAEGLAGSEVVLVPLPAGTGNDLARGLGIPRRPLLVASGCARASLREVDLWRWNDAAFLNIAGVGLDAAVARAIDRRLRRMRGTLAYAMGFLMVLPRFQPPVLELRFPRGMEVVRAAGAAPDSADRWRGRVLLVALANGTDYGGGMRIAPLADPADGQLDLVIVRDVGKLELLRAFPRVFRGGHLDHPAVTLLRAPAVAVAAEGDAPVMLDGESLGELPAQVTAASRLRVAIPPAVKGDG